MEQRLNDKVGLDVLYLTHRPPPSTDRSTFPLDRGPAEDEQPSDDWSSRSSGPPDDDYDAEADEWEQRAAEAEWEARQEALQQEFDERVNFELMVDSVVDTWSDDEDHVLAAISRARQQRDDATLTMRLLVAYARELIPGKRPTFEALASASGLTVSGVRVTYGPEDVEIARRVLESAGRISRRRSPVLDRAQSMADYVESLFTMTEHPLQERSKSILTAVFAATLLIEDSPGPVPSPSCLRNGVELPWPLDMATILLSPESISQEEVSFFTIDEYLYLMTVVPLLEPAATINQRRAAAELVPNVLGRYFFDGKSALLPMDPLRKLRSEDFAAPANRILALVTNKNLPTIVGHLRELAAEPRHPVPPSDQEEASE
jgi:hypothetical protein